MKIKYTKLAETAKEPTRAHELDAGLDLYVSRSEINTRCQLICHSDIAVEIPKGYVGLLFPRSSICRTSLSLTNAVGVIDSTYRGEIRAVFRQHGYSQGYEVGERFAQLLIMPLVSCELQETDKLSDTERGESGYGSSGK